MMKIAICDDEIQDIEILKQIVLSHSCEHEVICFTSAKDFLERFYSKERFDLLFLDVRMPDHDGWEIARELKLANLKVFIVMVTICGEYIYDCFDRVDWFVAKPITKDRIMRILNNAQERLFPIAIRFQTDTSEISLTAAEIMYLEIRRNTLSIHSTRGYYEVRLSLRKARDMLSHLPQFTQIHGSYIINLQHYYDVKDSCVVLKNKVKLRLSRGYRNSFFSALSEFIRSG